MPATRSTAVTPPALTASPVHPAGRLADICVLFCGLLLAAAGVVALLTVTFAGGDIRLVIGIAIYSAGLLAMLTCSLLFRATSEPRRRQFFRRLDHAAIFAMIAGSATPFALVGGDARGTFLTAALWAVAALGIVFKLRFPFTSVRSAVTVYLLLGWAALMAVGPTVSAHSVMLIAAGVAFYSAGVPFLLWRRLPYRLAIWHSFVLAGAACHYLAIVHGVVFA
jgi:hemolysin III